MGLAERPDVQFETFSYVLAWMRFLNRNSGRFRGKGTLRGKNRDSTHRVGVSFPRMAWRGFEKVKFGRLIEG